jgi:peptide/nickel transport system ATP-binding protein
MDDVRAAMRDGASVVDQPLLDVTGLSVAYPTSRGWLRALDDVSLAIPAGGVLGLVGESGSGKSSVVMALLGLLGTSARVRAERMAFGGQDLLVQAPSLRGRRIGVVFQDSSAVLNPALTIGSQVAEPLLVHRALRRPQAWARATELLAEMGITRPAQVMHCYPHQLSGGMKQRVGIATALASEPALLLLDEPTTALDVTVEAQILDLLDGLRVSRGLAMLLVSHNLAIVDRLCDRVSVLYAGRVAETGAAAEVFDRPRHPYTKGLLAARPRPDLAHTGRLSPIAGRLPDLVAIDAGCNFRPRCPFAAAECEQPQVLSGHDHLTRCHQAAEIAGLSWPGGTLVAASERPRVEHPLLQAEGLSRRFVTGGMLDRLFGRAGVGVLAVDDASFAVLRGEIVGLVGESGCGKSTVGRLLLRLVAADSGTLRFDGAGIGQRPDLAFRRRAQIVFQNPDTSLNPRQTVGTILRRPLRRFGLARDDAAQEIGRLLELVRLPPGFADRYPHQLSGGEKQRVGIARALATRPDFLVCDETVSALDVSVQAVVLNLLRDLRDELGVAYLFISHDIGVIAHIADRVVVMYRGSVVEEGRVRDVLRPPYHPYTELLLSSVPMIGKRRGTTGAARPAEEIGGPEVASGCKFAGRCARKIGPICETAEPPWQEVDGDHRIRCHVPLATLACVPPWLPVHAVANVGV